MDTCETKFILEYLYIEVFVLLQRNLAQVFSCVNTKHSDQNIFFGGGGVKWYLKSTSMGILHVLKFYFSLRTEEKYKTLEGGEGWGNKVCLR